MPLDPSILTGLVEAWRLDEGAGTTCVGAKRGTVLSLLRSDRITGAAAPSAGGWYTDGGGGPAVIPGPLYNGGGTCTLPIGGVSLGVHGAGWTVATMVWVDGWAIHEEGPGAAWGLFGSGDDYIHLCGFRGQSQIGELLPIGWAMVVQTPGEAQVWIWNGSTTEVRSAGIHPDGEIGAGGTRSLVVMTAEVQGPRIVWRIWVNGVARGELPEIPAELGAYLEATPFTLGDIERSHGTLVSAAGGGGAAVWNRRLSDAEIAALGDSLTDFWDKFFGPEPTDPGPFLTPQGTSALEPAAIERVDRGGVLASGGEGGGGGRHTRRVHDRQPRVYRLRFEQTTGAQVERIRQGLEVSRGGAAPLRWRHPVDDPPPPAAPEDPILTAPEYRIVGAGSVDGAQRQAIDRNAGGNAAETVLTLEAVEDVASLRAASARARFERTGAEEFEVYGL